MRIDLADPLGELGRGIAIAVVEGDGAGGEQRLVVTQQLAPARNRGDAGEAGVDVADGTRGPPRADEVVRERRVVAAHRAVDRAVEVTVRAEPARRARVQTRDVVGPFVAQPGPKEISARVAVPIPIRASGDGVEVDTRACEVSDHAPGTRVAGERLAEVARHRVGHRRRNEQRARVDVEPVEQRVVDRDVRRRVAAERGTHDAIARAWVCVAGGRERRGGRDPLRPGVDELVVGRRHVTLGKQRARLGE